ncbi:hypothetical protein [Timonella sp. A28]|uniref:hypothetical protein n=1 Tax=Timonella sp. A28 TaxID=3442640 RepID=UPI003EBEDC4E
MTTPPTNTSKQLDTLFNQAGVQPLLPKRVNLVTRMARELRLWETRRWIVAALTSAATILMVGIPTVLIPNPWFGREIPPTAWAWPVLIANAVLAGLVAATYVRRKDATMPDEKGGKLGMLGGFVTFFAVGCPVCNKLVLLALGYSGAIQFFEPIQPYLAGGAILLLAWAFIARVSKEYSCS